MSVKQNQQNVAKFDQWAKSYHGGRMDRWFTSGQGRVLEALDMKEDGWLLDIGCGTGWAVMEAARHLPDGKACGIDLSQGMVSRATKLADGLGNVEFQVADAESIPYPAESFDAAICTNSFHHYSEPVRALREIRRVLKPRGRLVLLDADRSGCSWVWLWDRFNRAFEKGHVKYYTHAEVFQVLGEAGFKQAELVSSEHHHFRNGKIGSATFMIRAIEEKPGT